jgi:DNA-binding MarR family transcriptional regulator
MSAAATPAPREETLEELSLAMQSLLASHRRLRSRDSRHPGEIGFGHYRLLVELRRAGTLTGSGLAAAAELSPATVTDMLDALEAGGLVGRHRDEGDRRVVHIRLTQKGRRAIDAKQARFRARLAGELSDLDPEALRSASVVVERLARLFDEL